MFSFFCSLPCPLLACLVWLTWHALFVDHRFSSRSSDAGHGCLNAIDRP